MNISDLKFYSLLFVALVVIGYVYLDQAADKENAYSEASNIDENQAVAMEIEQEPNEIEMAVYEEDESVLENAVGARGIIQLVSLKESGH